MIKALKLAALSGMFTLAAGVAHAACSTDIAKDDLTDAQAAELFECIEGKLLEGYNKSGKAVAGEYRNWFMPSTTPFISATHGKRFVNHLCIPDLLCFPRCSVLQGAASGRHTP